MASAADSIVRMNPENEMKDWLLYSTGRYRVSVLALLAISLLCLISPARLYAATGIDGTVTDGLNGVSGVPVYVWSYAAASGWSVSGSDITDGIGHYSVAFLYSAAASYRVCFYGAVVNYQTKCYVSAPDYALADPVTVVSGSMTTIPMTLHLVGKISGTVTDSVSNAVLPGISVDVYDPTETTLVAAGTTDAGGGYAIDNIPGGNYHVYFNGYSLGYLSQWYDGVNGVVPVFVSAPAETPGINAHMVKGGSISGTVTDFGTSAVLQGISVEIYQSGILIDSASTGADGKYNVIALPAGTYDVFFDGPSKGYDPAWHNSVAVALATVSTENEALLRPLIPLNDACGSARVISYSPYSDSINTSSATVDTLPNEPSPSCSPVPGAGMYNSVWYTVSPAYNGTAVIDTLGSNYDTILSVYTGACGALTEVPSGCNDDQNPNPPYVLQSYLSIPMTAGTTYYIMVSSVSIGGGDLTLNFNFAPTSWQLAVQPLGTGLIESSLKEISCGNTCAAYFPVNTSVSLAASGINNGGSNISTFVKWGGACSGNVSPCSVSSASGGTTVNVSAKFDACSNHSVFFLNDTFDSIGSAYSALAGAGEFDLRANMTYSLGLLEFSSPGKDVTLKGGLSCDFKTLQAPYSDLAGTLVISNGTVTADGISIGN